LKALLVGDEAFASARYEHENITVVRGSHLGRTQNGVNPGAGRIRIALVAPLADCLASARRLADFVRTHDFG